MPMDIDALAEIIKTRRSIRKWKDQKVPEELIRRGLELAIWAPNGGNYQGWHFVVIMDRTKIVETADYVQTVMDKISAWPESDTWRDDVERQRRSCSFFRHAPALIACFMREYQSVADKVLAEREKHDPEAAQLRAFRKTAPSGVQSIAAAITTMLLVYHAMGLGAVWLAVPLLAKTDIETLLEPPSEYYLAGCVALGHPDETPQKDRQPLENVMRLIK
jgi:nitroreductase